MLSRLLALLPEKKAGLEPAFDSIASGSPWEPRIREQPPSELIPELHANHSRTNHCLRHHKLPGVGEQTGIRIAQVLDIQMSVPGILRHPHRRIVGGIRRILEPQ